MTETAIKTRQITSTEEQLITKWQRIESMNNELRSKVNVSFTQTSQLQ